MPSNSELDSLPTYAEYMAWRNSFHARMNRMKEQQMNARALLNDLKDVTTGGKSLDELMVLATMAQIVRTTYEQKGVPVPEFIDEAGKTLNARITELNRDILEARLRELNQAEAALKTPSERRADIGRERERLEQLLGRKPEPVGSSS